MKRIKMFCTLLISLSLVITSVLFPARAVSEPISVVYGDLDKNGTINATTATVMEN